MRSQKQNFEFQLEQINGEIKFSGRIPEQQVKTLYKILFRVASAAVSTLGIWAATQFFQLPAPPTNPPLPLPPTPTRVQQQRG